MQSPGAVFMNLLSHLVVGEKFYLLPSILCYLVFLLILFLMTWFSIVFRYFRRYSVNKLFFPTGLTGLISAGMLAFYVYVLTSGGNPPKKQKPEAST